MKCINRIEIAILALMTGMLMLTGCKKNDIPIEYDEYDLSENYKIDMEATPKEMPLFAEDICATNTDIIDSSTINSASIYSAGVFDVNNKKTLYSYLIHTQVNPASLTKLMTVLLVLDNCSLDEMVTVPDVTIYEEGVQKFGLTEGDQISVGNLLYLTVVYSANDAALALAKYVGGSEEGFAVMMNDKAKALGATRSNFVNPHGLSHDDHYTTAYDLYLIFNACVKYEVFVNMINTKEYDITYTTAAGESVTKTIKTTDKFINGDYEQPYSVEIIGGKTGSTVAAGKCLIVYAKDASGNPYIGIIMGANDEQALYTTMRTLLNETVGN